MSTYISLYAAILGHAYIHINMYVFASFETGSYFVTLAALKLTRQTRIALNSQRSFCHPSAGTKGMSHHVPAKSGCFLLNSAGAEEMAQQWLHDREEPSSHPSTVSKSV